jgi:hypothetical protein
VSNEGFAEIETDWPAALFDAVGAEPETDPAERWF